MLAFAPFSPEAPAVRVAVPCLLRASMVKPFSIATSSTSSPLPLHDIQIFNVMKCTYIGRSAPHPLSCTLQKPRSMWLNLARLRRGSCTPSLFQRTLRSKCHPPVGRSSFLTPHPSSFPPPPLQCGEMWGFSQPHLRGTCTDSQREASHQWMRSTSSGTRIPTRILSAPP